MSNNLTSRLSLVACLLALACSSTEQAAPTEIPADKVAAPALVPTAPVPAAPAEPKAAGPSVEDPTFTLSAVAAGPYTANTLGHFVLSLTPKGEYHVNEEYPIAITMSAPPGVTLAKAELAKGDAAEFSAKTARFDVPVTPTQVGEHHVTAKVSFAVCTPENCVPDERTLDLALLVQ